MTRRVLLSSLTLISCSARKPAPLAVSRPVLPAAIPAGTQIALRTVDRIIADASPGQGFAAVLSSEIPDIAVPGSPARITVTGNTLRLSALMINGSWHALGTPGHAAPLGTLVRSLLPYPYPKGNTAIVTEGPRLHVPPGSILIFRLDNAAPVSASYRPPDSSS